MKKRIRPCWPLIFVVALFATSVVATFVGCANGGSTKSGGSGSTKPGGGYDPPPPAPTAHSIYEDIFNVPQLDTSIWVRHGSGVSVSGGFLCIDSPAPWQSGVEGVKHFFQPRAGDRLTVAGSVSMPADSLRSVSLVYIQDHWRVDDPDCYVLRFVRNDEFEGDNNVEFRVKNDGSWVEEVGMGGFSNGDVINWKFTIYPSYCEVEVGSSTHSTPLDVHDLGVSLHGSGSPTYWGFVEVTLWDVHYAPA